MTRFDAQYEVPRLDLPAPEGWDEETDGEWVPPIDLDALLASYKGVTRVKTPPVAEVRHLSVQGLLEWAFADEHAKLDFGDIRAPGGWIDSCAMLADQGDLGGVRIDTSRGRSLPADGAQDVARVIAGAFCNDRNYAQGLARLARLRSAPDWGEGRELVCHPDHWLPGRVGAVAQKEVRQEHVRVSKKRWKTVRVELCPVHFENTADVLAALRRNYLDWRLSLLLLRPALKALKINGIVCTGELPPMRPWESTAKIVDGG